MFDLMISVHIPKTGGTTFSKFLEKVFGQGLFIDHPWMEKTFLLNNASSVQERLNNIRCVHGHFYYSKYAHLKNEADLTVTYVTWMRDPVERVMSTYHFLRDKPLPEDSEIYPWEEAAKNHGIVEFLKRGFVKDNQSMQLGGDNLDAFDYIGITEDYDNSMRLFKNMFFRDSDVSLDIEPQLVGKHRSGKKYDVDPDVRAMIEEINQKDFLLYKKGLDKYHSLCEKYL